MFGSIERKANLYPLRDFLLLPNFILFFLSVRYARSSIRTGSHRPSLKPLFGQVNNQYLQTVILANGILARSHIKPRSW